MFRLFNFAVSTRSWHDTFCGAVEQEVISSHGIWPGNVLDTFLNFYLYLRIISKAPYSKKATPTAIRILTIYFMYLAFLNSVILSKRMFNTKYSIPNQTGDSINHICFVDNNRTNQEGMNTKINVIINPFFISLLILYLLQIFIHIFKNFFISPEKIMLYVL